MPHTDRETTEEIVARLRSRIDQYNSQQQQIPISISIGLAVSAAKESSLEETYKEAAGVLGFVVLSNLIAELTILLGKVVVSVVIFGIGLYLAGVAKEVVLSSGSPHAELLSRLARIAVLVLAGAIALQQLGVADEIIIIAFGVLIGAIALTGVIAFGLGGRDVASRELSTWVDDLKKKE